jgi:hypothetical protein
MIMFAGSQARWVALAVMCASSLMNVPDTTIVSVALPAISRREAQGRNSQDLRIGVPPSSSRPPCC